MKRRKRISAGVYRDKYGLSAAVKVGPRDGALQAEKRFPFDTGLGTIREWQEAMRVELRRKLKRPQAVRGTLETDAKSYLAQVRHLASRNGKYCSGSSLVAGSRLAGGLAPSSRNTWVEESQIPQRRDATYHTPLYTSAHRWACLSMVWACARLSAFSAW